MKSESDGIRDLVRSELRRQIGGDPTASEKSEDAVLLSPIDESVRTVITEAEVRAVPEGCGLMIREDAVVTPLAKDLIEQRRIQLHYRSRRRGGGKGRLIAIGADHGGFEFKRQLVEFLTESGYQIRDFGTTTSDPVDYPDYAHSVASAVSDGHCDFGILLDGAGIGSCMAANKVPGIRAAMCYDVATARNSREHNYANVLTLGAKMLPARTLLEIVQAWLETPEGEARHGKRVAKIMAIERQYVR